MRRSGSSHSSTAPARGSANPVSARSLCSRTPRPTRTSRSRGDAWFLPCTRGEEPFAAGFDHYAATPKVGGNIIYALHLDCPPTRPKRAIGDGGVIASGASHPSFGVTRRDLLAGTAALGLAAGAPGLVQ